NDAVGCQQVAEIHLQILFQPVAKRRRLQPRRARAASAILTILPVRPFPRTYPRMPSAALSPCPPAAAPLRTKKMALPRRTAQDSSRAAPIGVGLSRGSTGLFRPQRSRLLP